MTHPSNPSDVEDTLKCGTFNKSDELVELENIMKIGNPHLAKGKISVDWLAIIAYYKADEERAVAEAKMETPRKEEDE